jgi:hypothetical protein
MRCTFRRHLPPHLVHRGQRQAKVGRVHPSREDHPAAVGLARAHLIGALPLLRPNRCTIFSKHVIKHRHGSEISDVARK